MSVGSQRMFDRDADGLVSRSVWRCELAGFDDFCFGDEEVDPVSI
jgi:hypothetical protein